MRFFDTNVIVYAFSDDPRSERATALLGEGGVISVQVLNEFANVARRKLKFDWRELHAALRAVRTLCPRIVSIDLETHEMALKLAETYSFGLYDALIASAALSAGCDVLCTEDLSHGQRIERRLVIENPFPSG